jgi:hypothetical protein
VIVATVAPYGALKKGTGFPGLAEAAAPWATNEQPYGLRKKVAAEWEVSGSVNLAILPKITT